MTRCTSKHFYADGHKIATGAAKVVIDGKPKVVVARSAHNSGEIALAEFAELVAAGRHDGSLVVETPTTPRLELHLDPFAYQGRSGRASGTPNRGSLTDLITPLIMNRTNSLLAKTFASSPHQLYLVGGSVRDSLSGKAKFDDLDYTTDARPDDIESMVVALGPIWVAGKRFGTIGVTPSGHGQKVEVTTFRAEQYEDDSRKPVVSFGDSIEDDLVRRDFTINAMAIAMVDGGGYTAGQLVDPFGGLEDLEKGILRTPGNPIDTMSEDPLRIDRALRFAAMWGFDLHPDLAVAIAETSERQAVVSTERRTEELRKILKGGGAALARAMELSAQLGVALPITSNLQNDSQSRKLASKLDGPTALAGLVYLTGDTAGPDALKSLVLSNEEQRAAVSIAELTHKMLGEGNVIDARRVIRAASDEQIDSSFAIADLLIDGSTQHSLQNSLLNEVRLQRHLTPQLRAPLPVNGDDLIKSGMAPGPRIGRSLTAVMAAYLENPDLSRDTAIEIASAVE